MAKYVLVFLLAVVAILGGKLYWDKHRLGKAYDQLNGQLMQANLELGKAKTAFGKASEKLEKLEKDLQASLLANNELITKYSELEAKYTALANFSPQPDIVYVEGPAVEVPKELNLIRGLLYEAITEHTLAPLASIGANASDHRLSLHCIIKPFTNTERLIPVSLGYELHLKIGAQLIETIMPSGAVNNYVRLFELDDKGKPVGEFQLTKFSVLVEDRTKSHFMWWAPRLDFGVNLNLTQDFKFTPNGSFGISVMAYGKTRADMSWRFLRFGFDFTRGSVGASFAPALWNFGTVLPLIENLWLGPNVGIMSDGSKMFGLSFNVGL